MPSTVGTHQLCSLFYLLCYAALLKILPIEFSSREQNYVIYEIRHIGAPQSQLRVTSRITMVQCVVLGCTSHTDPRPGSNQNKNISFHRIPAVHDREGKEDYELRKRQRDGYLDAIHREDLDFHALHKYRICSKHFVSGTHADL